MHRVTTLLHSCLATRASSGTNIPWRCNGRSRRGLCVKTQSVRGSETIFNEFFNALFHHPGSLRSISSSTLLFAAFCVLKFLTLVIVYSFYW